VVKQKSKSKAKQLHHLGRKGLDGWLTLKLCQFRQLRQLMVMLLPLLPLLQLHRLLLFLVALAVAMGGRVA
jgi:hypothetical protein